MDTLMNVASIPEESGSRLPSEGVPPVTAAGSQRCGTGVSLEYVLHPTHGLPQECRWYVLRATYGREREAEDLLEKRGVLVYVPKRREEESRGIPLAQSCFRVYGRVHGPPFGVIPIEI